MESQSLLRPPNHPPLQEMKKTLQDRLPVAHLAMALTKMKWSTSGLRLLWPIKLTERSVKSRWVRSPGNSKSSRDLKGHLEALGEVM